MNEGVVVLERDVRGVATISLNRPEVNNAYDDRVIAALTGCVAECAADAAVRVVVLRGRGRHFQAGADLGWIERVGREDAAANERASRGTAEAVRELDRLGKPTVALVHGGCFGGGVGVVAACDVVIATRDAVFSISETRWGLMAGIILPQLVAAIGLRQVRRYALTCERFDAARACAIGLVHEVCEPGELDAAAAPVIDGLLLSAPLATAATKRRALACAGTVPDQTQLDELVREHAAARRQPEAAEGLASFHERRKPAWYTGE